MANLKREGGGELVKIVEHFVAVSTSSNGANHQNVIRRAVVFDTRPLAQQLKDTCSLLGVPFDHKDEYRLFTREAGAGSLRIQSELELLALPEHSQVGLNLGRDVVKARINALQDLCPGVGAMDLVGSLLMTIQSDQWLADEVVANDGIGVLLDVVMAGDPTVPNWASLVELAMACMCQLFSLSRDETIFWLEEHRSEFLGAPLFARLLAVIFPTALEDEVGMPLEHTGGGHPDGLPRASLNAFLFLLRELNCAMAAMEAAAHGATGLGRSASAGLGGAYPVMFSALRGEAEDGGFGMSSAIIALHALVNAAIREELRTELRNDLIIWGDEEEVELFFQKEARQETLFDQLLGLSMGVCSELAAANGGTSHGRRGLWDKVAQLQVRNQHLQETIKRLQADVQSKHNAMVAMLPFVRVDNSLIVEESLDTLVRNGWNSIRWRANYTLLHFAAECIDDPKVVSLVGAFADDIELKDDTGRRAIDYADERGASDVVVEQLELLAEKAEYQKIERHRRRSSACLKRSSPRSGARTKVEKRRTGFSQVAPKTDKESDVEEAIITHRLLKLEPISETLLERIKDVLRFGVDRLSWPGGFSPLHLAAQEGHLEAVKLLVKSRADPSAHDDSHLTPLDYAAQSSMGVGKPVVALLQELIARPDQCDEPSDDEAQVVAMCSLMTTKKSNDGEESEGTCENGTLGPKSLAMLQHSYSMRVERERVMTDATSDSSASDADFGLSAKQLMTFQKKLSDTSVVTEVEPADVHRSSLSVKGQEGVLYRKLTMAARDIGLTDLQLDRLHERMSSVDDSSYGLGDHQLESLRGKNDLKESNTLVMGTNISGEGPPSQVRFSRGAIHSDDGRVIRAVSACSSMVSADLFPERCNVRVRRAVYYPEAPSASRQSTSDDSEGSEPMMGICKQPAIHNKKLEAVATERKKVDALRLPSAPDVTSRRLTQGTIDSRKSFFMVNMNSFDTDNTSARVNCSGSAKSKPLSANMAKLRLLTYLNRSLSFGREAVLATLQEKLPSTEGMNLETVYQHFALVLRLCTEGVNLEDAFLPLRPVDEAPSPGAGAVDGARNVPGAGDTAADGAPKGSDKGSAKGKPAGKGPPPPDGGKAAADSAPAEKGPAKGKESHGKAKGKPPPEGKGKPPPPPPVEGKGKGPPTGEDPASAKGGPKGPGGKGPKGPKGPGGKAPLAKGDGKGKKGKVEPTKPKIAPKATMKPFWWTRFLMGVQIKPGETIWDLVNDDVELLPIDDLVSRFGKVVKEPKVKEVRQQAQGPAANVPQGDDAPKVLRIITDPQLVVGREVAVKKLPPAHELTKAIMELDREVIGTEELQSILANACPNPEQLDQLQKLRAANPMVPLAMPEQFMWVVSRIPFYKARLDCWMFLRTYSEKRLHCSEALRQFDEVIECLRSSKTMASFLGVILAVGNYCNGGTERGQADGFGLDSLATLATVKDSRGEDLRHFILKTFFGRKDIADAFMTEHRPLFANVARGIGKDSDGVERLIKKVVVAIEDFDPCVNELEAELRKAEDALEIILQNTDDPTDRFRLEMPESLKRATEVIGALIKQRDRTREKFKDLTTWLKVSAMKTSDFCILWDDLLVPEALIVNASEKMKKSYLIPNFCKPKPISLESLLVLWKFVDPEESKALVQGKKGKEDDAKARRVSQTRRIKPVTRASMCGGNHPRATKGCILSADRIPETRVRAAGFASSAAR